MSDGYDHSTFEGFLRDYLRWFIVIVLILSTIGGLAVLATKPPVPVDAAQIPQEAPQAGIQHASSPVR